MTFNHTDRFVVLLSGGAGMLLAGAVNALLGPVPARWRAVATGAGCGAALGVAAAWSVDPRLRAAAAGVMAVGVLPALLAGSGSVVAAARRAAALGRRPGVRWGLLAVVGAGTAFGSVALYQAEDDAQINQEMVELGLEDRPPLADPVGVTARTDRGTPIPVKESTSQRTAAEVNEAEERFYRSSPYRDRVIRDRDADDGANCHGWVFAGGRYWLGGEWVETILRENGYAEVTDPRPGDLAVYRQGPAVVHSAVVRYATPGAPVLVEGKWGWMGVYLHPADRCPYRAEVKYYHSPRHGHLLAGLDESSSEGR